MGEGTETAFQKYKALFYSLRILRELVPALTIGVSLATFFTAFFTAFLKDSYGMAVMSPVQSFALDKIVAHFIFMTYPDERYRPEAMHVYGPDWTRVGHDDWKGAAPDHWWCLKYKLDHPLAVHELNGTCLTPAWLGGDDDFCHWDSYEMNSSISEFNRKTGRKLRFDFPSGDPGFGCVTPGMSNFPTVEQTGGDCYSVCIDVVGETPWARTWMPLDGYTFMLLPFIADSFFIAAHLWKATLLEGYFHYIPLSRRLGYWLLGLTLIGVGDFFYIWGFKNLGVRYLFWKDGFITGWLSWVPALFFLGLAWESKANWFGRCVRCLMWPYYKSFMWSIDVKKLEDTIAKWDICTGEALCYYLVEIYQTKCAGALGVE